MQELELLNDEAKVYKLIGPAFIHQDHAEATSNVSKRLEFIDAELSRLDTRIKANEEKANKRQAQIEQLQTEAARINRAAAHASGGE